MDKGKASVSNFKYCFKNRSLFMIYNSELSVPKVFLKNEFGTNNVQKFECGPLEFQMSGTLKFQNLFEN